MLHIEVATFTRNTCYRKGLVFEEKLTYIVAITEIKISVGDKTFRCWKISFYDFSLGIH